MVRFICGFEATKDVDSCWSWEVVLEGFTALVRGWACWRQGANLEQASCCCNIKCVTGCNWVKWPTRVAFADDEMAARKSLTAVAFVDGRSRSVVALELC